MDGASGSVEFAIGPHGMRLLSRLMVVVSVVTTVWLVVWSAAKPDPHGLADHIGGAIGVALLGSIFAVFFWRVSNLRVDFGEDVIRVQNLGRAAAACRGRTSGP